MALFSGAEPFMQFWKRASWGPLCETVLNLERWLRRYEYGPVVQEEIFLSRALAVPLFCRVGAFEQFW